MTGWDLLCPVCWDRVTPPDAFLWQIAPRLAYHLWDEHPYEAALLRLFLQRSPAAWPVLEVAA